MPMAMVLHQFLRSHQHLLPLLPLLPILLLDAMFATVNHAVELAKTGESQVNEDVNLQIVHFDFVLSNYLIVQA